MALAVRITGALIPPFSLYSFEGNFPAEQYECMTTPRDISPCRRVQIYATVREWTQCQSAWKLFSNFVSRNALRHDSQSNRRKCVRHKKEKYLALFSREGVKDECIWRYIRYTAGRSRISSFLRSYNFCSFIHLSSEPCEVARGTATPLSRSVPVALPRIYSAELITRR